MKKFAIALLALISIASATVAIACEPVELPPCTVTPEGMICEEE